MPDTPPNYTQHQKLSTTKHFFSDRSHVYFFSKEQYICKMFLRKSFLDLSNLSECHLILLLDFYGVLYTSTITFGGIPLKALKQAPKYFSLNSYYRENKLDLSLRLVPNGFWRTQGFLSVRVIVNHMFIIFGFH